MITAGYFCGQCLGDLITMRAETVDLKTGMNTMNRRKTGKQVIIPLSKSLLTLLVSIWPKNGKRCFWPSEAERHSTVGASPFSQEFYDLMADAGMVAGPYPTFDG
jgi:integrase